MELSSLALPKSLLERISVLQELQLAGRTAEAKAMAREISESLVNCQPALAALLLVNYHGWSGFTVATEDLKVTGESEPTRFLGLKVGSKSTSTERRRRRSTSYRFR